MKCPKCQSENREGVKFCAECGNKMEIKCHSCNAFIPIGKKFCGECGHNLHESKDAPPVDYEEPKSYTPKFLADKILTSRSAIQGERKHVTVLFADVAGYTTLSEKLDPEEVHQIMDGALKSCWMKFISMKEQSTSSRVMASWRFLFPLCPMRIMHSEPATQLFQFRTLSVHMVKK